MISRLVGIEQQRLKSLGFNSVVTPISISIDKSITNINLGNDCYILTGIRMADTDIAADTHTVSLTSASDGLTDSERNIGMLGQGIMRTFRSFLIVKTMRKSDDSFVAGVSVPSFALDFIKVTPTL